jgi:hypothetical protein
VKPWGEDVTRRGLLVRGLAFGLAGVGCTKPTGTQAREGDAMLSEERPIWERQDLWERAARGAHPGLVEKEAVKLLPGDPPVRGNYHALLLGDARHLAGQAGTFFSMVREKCGFSSLDPWDDQKGWLEATFQSFFNCVEEVGWVSLVMARRPSQLHHVRDARVRISHEPSGATPRPVRRAKHLGLAPLSLSLEATEFSVVTKGLRMSCGDDTVRKSGQVFVISVPRAVEAPQLGVARKHYREVWVCLGQAGQDEERLRRGEIPAVPAAQYRGPLVRVRSTPILSLAKVSLGSLRLIEVDPRDGKILSLRRAESRDLRTGLIKWGPGESEAISRALRAITTQ